MFYQYDWDWTGLWAYKGALLSGLLVTLELTFLSVVFGTLLGFFFGIISTFKDEQWREIRLIVLVFIDVVRSLPLLILLLLFNFWLPYMVGLRIPFWLSVCALSLNLSAFIADVLRGAIEGVPRPYKDAGLAVGMTERTVLRRIVVPEATRSIIPTIALLYIDILKMSSLASVIAVDDLVHKATEISSQNFRYLEVVAVLACIYIALILPFSYGVRCLEKSSWFLRRS